MQKAYYQIKIEEEFCLRQRKNSKYSLRAYAQFLGLSSSELSAIFKGKRTIPKKKVDFLLERLVLNPLECAEFKSSIKYWKQNLASLSKQEVKKTSQLLHETQDYSFL